MVEPFILRQILESSPEHAQSIAGRVIGALAVVAPLGRELRVASLNRLSVRAGVIAMLAITSCAQVEAS